MKCVDKDSAEYKNLKKMTGVSDKALQVHSIYSMDVNGRMPEIDEVPNADSLPVMTEELGLKFNESTGRFSTKMENFAPDGNVDSRVIATNNRFKDLEASAYEFGETVIMDVVRRPNIGTFHEGVFDVDSTHTNADKKVIFDTIAEKMSTRYGVNIHVFNHNDIPNMPELNNFDYGLKNAFILNGEIYVNTDFAGLDAPIHEMMHMLLGEMKFNDRDLYNEIVSSMSEIPGFDAMRRNLYGGITERDAMEEIFVTQVAKRMAGMENIIDKLPKAVRSKIEYNVARMLDSTLMGSNSAHGFKFEDLGRYSMLELCEKLGSSILNNKTKINNDLGFSHRIALNLKRELLNEGKLEEIC